MGTFDVYLYGMVVATNSFLLAGAYPKPDTYGEIKMKHKLPGGETGTCATVLSSLGCTVLMDGNHMGSNVFPVIKAFYQGTKVDISRLTHDITYDGLEDYVIIDKDTRTPFGMFGSFYSDPVKRWNKPRLEDILAARVVGLDPFFGEEAEFVAKVCMEYKIPYVTIDCKYDSLIHKNANVTIISGEFFGYTYTGEVDKEELFEQYITNGNGLVIFTRGSKEIWYGRKKTGKKVLKPYEVLVESTLGAGDTFKAGCVYALLKGMEDEDLVRFANACAAVACTRFPLPTNPPTLSEVMALVGGKITDDNRFNGDV